MSEVTLQVGGRSYPVSCADGEEDHVRRLAGVVDSKLAQLGGQLAPGDAKNLLFAALILADEVEEARRSLPQHESSGGQTPSSKLELIVARNLEAVADRLENLAWKLESAQRNT